MGDTNCPSRRKADFLKMNTTILVTLVTLSMAAIPRSREEIRDEAQEMREEIEEQRGGLVDHDDTQLKEKSERYSFYPLSRPSTPPCRPPTWRCGDECCEERSLS